MGEVVQFRDFQNPKDLERSKREAGIQNQAADLMHQVLFGAPLYSDLDLNYMAPDKDPA